jgi:tetratricopeptide (TPR) repeat protein
MSESAEAGWTGEDAMKPLCFILMPFGPKPNPAGGAVDFDRVYAELIQPAVTAADLEPLRADQETVGGIIHKPMFERLVLCPYAVADLTLANANVFYELGIRHAFRPWSTVPIIADANRLPFDVQMLRTIQYRLGPDGGPDAAQLENGKAAIANMLKAAKSGAKDSPLFQLVDGITPAIVPHEKTDVFQRQVDYANVLKNKLAAARKQGEAGVSEVEQSLGDIAQVESGVVIDLFLAYRDTKAWQAMVDLVARMTPPLRETVMVQEQYALALNRLERSDEAERVLKNLIDSRGPSSETQGILGRVYKDRWEKAKLAGDKFAARGYLDNAIAAYVAGFESDWRDAYPGINAVTLMEIKDPPDPRRLGMIPVVRYSVVRKIAKGQPDYWDFATMVELAVLAGNEGEALEMFSKALAAFRFPWEAETTARNLRLIREARQQRGETPAWAREIEDELTKKAGGQ